MRKVFVLLLIGGLLVGLLVASQPSQIASSAPIRNLESTDIQWLKLMISQQRMSQPLPDSNHQGRNQQIAMGCAACHHGPVSLPQTW